MKELKEIEVIENHRSLTKNSISREMYKLNSNQ